MATLENTAGTSFASFNPISSVLNNLPNGAGTIAALVRDPSGSTGSIDACGLVSGAGPISAWYHTMQLINVGGSTTVADDDGIAAIIETPSWSGSLSTWYIIAVTWNAGGASGERFHHINQQSPAGWTHSNSAGNNGGNRAGPGTSSGRWRIGYFEDNTSISQIALCAAWVGNTLSDAQIAELSANNRTSDWWNNSDGHPDLLVECNTLSLVDIGANPSTFSSIGGLTLTGPSPTWTFDGQGTPAVEKQTSYYRGRGISIARR